MISQVLTSRLLAVYKPEWILKYTEKEVRAAEPISDWFHYAERDKSYDLGRIHHFLQELEEGKTLDPIITDNEIYSSSSSYVSWGPPKIMDGHHRFAAYVLLKRKRIPCSCGGLVTHIDWLVGKTRRDRPPLEMSL